MATVWVGLFVGAKKRTEKVPPLIANANQIQALEENDMQ